MEPTIYKPTIYNAPTIYKTGAEGGGGGGGGETVEIGGKVYPVVTIGTQKWLGLNLDYAPDGINIGGAGEIYTPNAWYYSNNEPYYGFNNKKYGLLYNHAAIELISSILPPNFKVPEKSDFDILISYIGNNDGIKLKSPYDWSSGYGKDEFKFSALPSGLRNYNGSYLYISTNLFLWTKTLQSSEFYYDFELDNDGNTTISSNYKTNAFALRLLKIE